MVLRRADIPAPFRCARWLCWWLRSGSCEPRSAFRRCSAAVCAPREPKPVVRPHFLMVCTRLSRKGCGFRFGPEVVRGTPSTSSMQLRRRSTMRRLMRMVCPRCLARRATAFDDQTLAMGLVAIHSRAHLSNVLASVFCGARTVVLGLVSLPCSASPGGWTVILGRYQSVGRFASDNESLGKIWAASKLRHSCRNHCCFGHQIECESSQPLHRVLQWTTSTTISDQSSCSKTQMPRCEICGCAGRASSTIVTDVWRSPWCASAARRSPVLRSNVANCLARTRGRVVAANHGTCDALTRCYAPADNLKPAAVNGASRTVCSLLAVRGPVRYESPHQGPCARSS